MLGVANVLRVKGRVAVTGKSAPATVQAVGPRLDVSFAPGAEAGGLVVIGLRPLDETAIAAALAG